MIEAEPGPISGVSVCVVRDGQVLLAKRGNANGFGLWSFPGGHVHEGEPLRDAALRELAEETGVNARIVKILDTLEIKHRDPAGGLEAHFILSVFLGEYLSGEAVANSDATAVKWVNDENVFELKTTPGTAEFVAAAIKQVTQN